MTTPESMAEALAELTVEDLVADADALDAMAAAEQLLDEARQRELDRDREMRVQFVSIEERHLDDLRASLSALYAILVRNGGHLWPEEQQAMWRAKELLGK